MNGRRFRVFFVLWFLMGQVSSRLPALQAQESLLHNLPRETKSEPKLETQDGLYLDFKGAKLINVLAVLSELSGINYVAGKEVANREVNMVLDGVTVEDALDAIGRGSNISYDYFPNRNLYLFRAAADKEDLPRLVTRVFKLYYIQASELREIEAGGGGGSTGGGTSTGNTFATLSEKTEPTEEPTSPILKIVESILSERGRVKVDSRSNSLVITDAEDRLKMIEEAIVQLDRKIDQVLINVILVETLEDLDRFLGIEWGGNTTTGQEGTLGLIQGASTETRFPFNINNYGAFSRLFGKTSFNKEELSEDADVVNTEGVKDFTDLDIRIRALQTANKVRIIAKPKILVLDNHPALIKITTNATVGSATASTASAGSTLSSTTSAERSETGTSLRVTPLINTENRITMTLEPRFVTAASSGITVSNVATRDPTTRTARTTLMVNSGETIVMGGLLSSQQINDDRKVPFLGDIPFVGEIFRRRTKQFEDREMMLFVTPIIIRDPSEVQTFSIPDHRERLDEVTAPFWKVKQQKWYHDLKKKKESEPIEIGAYVQSRDRIMDESLQKLTEEAKAVPAELSQPAKTADKPQAPETKKSSLSKKEPASSKSARPVSKVVS